MNRYIWIACFAFSLFVSCTGSTNVDGASASKMPKPTTTAKPSQKMKSAPVGLNKPKAASGSLQIAIGNTNAKKGEEACVSMTSKSFNSILGLQYSILFDPAQLKFTKSTKYGLPGLNDGSFGTTKAEQGSINFLWFDMNVKGVSLPETAVLYDLCFEVLANNGATCEVSIGDKPLKKEVVGPNKSRLNLESISGKISVQ